MNCENEFCVYCKDGQCILEEICLDSTGSCMECIHISLEEEILNEKKQKFLERTKSDFEKN